MTYWSEKTLSEGGNNKENQKFLETLILLK